MDLSEYISFKVDVLRQCSTYYMSTGLAPNAIVLNTEEMDLARTFCDLCDVQDFGHAGRAKTTFLGLWVFPVGDDYDREVFYCLSAAKL